MLNEFFITRDAPAHLLRFLKQHAEESQFEDIQARLEFHLKAGKITYEQWWELLADTNTVLELPALGIEVGRQIRAEHCGVIGYLFRTSESVIEALQCYQRFERLLYAGSRVRSTSTGREKVKLSWDPENGLSSQISDSLLLSALVNIIREILDDKTVSPSRVTFTSTIAENEKGIYRHFFQCPVLFAQQRLEISFDNAILMRKIPFHDRALHSLLDKQAESLVGQLPEHESFIGEVRDAMVKALNEGQADAKSIARRICISERTLHRRLRESDFLFRDLLKDVRMTLAKRYVNDRNLSLTEVAMLLGYSEQSAFNRAFRAWFGKAPRQMRKNSVGQTDALV